MSLVGGWTVHSCRCTSSVTGLPSSGRRPGRGIGGHFRGSVADISSSSWICVRAWCRYFSPATMIHVHLSLSTTTPLAPGPVCLSSVCVPVSLHPSAVLLLHCCQRRRAVRSELLQLAQSQRTDHIAPPDRAPDPRARQRLQSAEAEARAKNLKCKIFLYSRHWHDNAPTEQAHRQSFPGRPVKLRHASKREAPPADPTEHRQLPAPAGSQCQCAVDCGVQAG